MAFDSGILEGKDTGKAGTGSPALTYNSSSVAGAAGSAVPALFGSLGAIGKFAPLAGPVGLISLAVGGGIYSFKSTRKAGEEARKMAYRRASIFSGQAERVKKAAIENLYEMERKRISDVKASRVAAAKAGVLPGAGSAGETERKITREYQRGKKLYAQTVQNEMQSLYDAAAQTVYEGKQVEKAYKRQALGNLFGSTTNLAMMAAMG